MKVKQKKQSISVTTEQAKKQKECDFINTHRRKTPCKCKTYFVVAFGLWFCLKNAMICQENKRNLLCLTRTMRHVCKFIAAHIGGCETTGSLSKSHTEPSVKQKLFGLCS